MQTGAEIITSLCFAIAVKHRTYQWCIETSNDIEWDAMFHFKYVRSKEEQFILYWKIGLNCFNSPQPVGRT